MKKGVVGKEKEDKKEKDRVRIPTLSENVTNNDLSHHSAPGYLLPGSQGLETATDQLVSQDLVWAWRQQKVGRSCLLILCVLLRVYLNLTPRAFNVTSGRHWLLFVPFFFFFSPLLWVTYFFLP